MCREMIAGGRAVYVAEGLLGAIHAYEGRLRRRGACSPPRSRSRRATRHYNMTIDTTAALARVAAAEGDGAEARERCGAVLEHWQASDDHHYALAALRWAAAHLAGQGDREARTPAPRR